MIGETILQCLLWIVYVGMILGLNYATIMLVIDEYKCGDYGISTLFAIITVGFNIFVIGMILVHLGI